MPSQWRDRVPASELPGVRDVLAQWQTRSAWGWLLTLAVPFAVVLISDVPFGLEVLYVVALAVAFTAFAAQQDREELARSTANLGVAQARWPLTIPWVATLFMSTLGWVGIAAFAAGLVALAVS